MSINFNITRLVEKPQAIGCNDFQTNQLYGDVAALSDPSAPADLDGDIIWYINADPGYEVDNDNFSIPNTVEETGHSLGSSTKILLPDPQYDWNGIGSGITPVPFEGIVPPMLGVEFTEISSTKIRVTIYLHPTNADFRNITGPIFTMPNNDVSVYLPIDGCAQPDGRRVTFRMVNDNPDDTDADFVVAEDFASNFNIDETTSNEIEIDGLISQAQIGELLGTYTVSAKKGSRFLSEPNIELSTKDFEIKPKLTKDENGNAISKSFGIYKK
tara:strand:- start:133 stop:945 length:813 start_codon:yes stop_codon:yes gene_type:complete